MEIERYQIGTLLLDAGTQEVTRNGVPVSLPPLSYALLLTLVRHAPNVVTTAQLEAEVWSGLVIDRGTINKRVVLVRNALKQAGCERDYIAVVRGTGYRLTVPVSRAGETPEVKAEPEETVVPAASSPSTGTSVQWAVLAALALVLVVVVGRDWIHASRETARESAVEAARQAGADFSGASSIAVMPFEAASEDDNDRYFAEGVSRELVRLLGENEGLGVASSTSSFTFRDSGLDNAEIADQLGVETLLEGSVQRDGERLLVMASLVHAPSGRALWADRFDLSMDEVYQVQGEIASRVVTALRSPGLASVNMSSRGVPSANIEAYTLYLKGRAQLDERLNRQSEAIQDALESFQASVRLDPQFVRAHVGIASASFLMPSYLEGADRTEWLERAETSALFALDLDPESAEATGVLAAIVSWQGEPLRAAGLFERAMELGNQDPDVLHWHAMLATSMGYFDGLLPLLQDAYRLDPLNQLLGCSLAGSLNFSGQPDRAMIVLGGMERFSRRDLATAVASLYLGDWEQARTLLRGIQLRMGALPPAYADLLVEAFENPPRRRFVEDAFVDGVAGERVPPLVAFEALLIMGSPRAFDLEVSLEGSYFEHRLPEAVWHNWGVELRRDPRFKGWVRALGYDQHWRRYGWPDRCRPTGLNDFECV
ncbi:MAG: winged helix-turn-helix domain-containing protein [Xanthomonadales bacterium]|jgi:TolB-like protein/DNA-binding winged helix-turn-helix (wHTH) protein|nr:winged helix-turn-helix domain-containing protein [Xanthomonadales bacterium]